MGVLVGSWVVFISRAVRYHYYCGRSYDKQNNSPHYLYSYDNRVTVKSEPCCEEQKCEKVRKLREGPRCAKRK